MCLDFNHIQKCTMGFPIEMGSRSTKLECTKIYNAFPWKVNVHTYKCAQIKCRFPPLLWRNKIKIKFCYITSNVLDKTDVG